MMKKYFMVLCVALIAISCEYTDSKLVIINKTSLPVSYTATMEDSLIDMHYIGKAEYYLRVQIQPNDSARVLTLGRGGWEEAVRSNKNKKLNLFVFQADTIERYRIMENIISRRLYQRYEYSLEYLKVHNWRIEIK